MIFPSQKRYKTIVYCINLLLTNSVLFCLQNLSLFTYIYHHLTSIWFIKEYLNYFTLEKNISSIFELHKKKNLRSETNLPLQCTNNIRFYSIPTFSYREILDYIVTWKNITTHRQADMFAIVLQKQKTIVWYASSSKTKWRDKIS